MPIELPASSVEQLPVAALLMLCAAVVGRYAARLAEPIVAEPIVADRLAAGQERTQRQLVEAPERNTAARRDTCATPARLEAGVTGRRRPARPRKEVDIG